VSNCAVLHWAASNCFGCNGSLAVWGQGVRTPLSSAVDQNLSIEAFRLVGGLSHEFD
jgi:hypothetical protein